MYKELSDIFYKAINDYMQFFLYNRSHTMLKLIQESRSNIKIYNVTKDQMANKKILKHKCFDDRYDHVYITLPYDYLTAGERINFKDIRKIRYELLPMNKINSLFGNTIDVFYDGRKILSKDLKIALYDNYFVVEMPYEYKDFTKMLVMKRPYVFDMYCEDKTIKIPKKSIRYGCTIDSIIVYMNNYECDNYSIVEYDDYYLLKTPVDIKTMEITFIKNLKKFGYKTFPNGYIDMRSERGRYPINSDGIISFRNGLFVNLGFEAVTGDIFKSSIITDYEYLIYYTYQEYDYENNYYDDNFEWYANYKEDIMDIINNPALLPEFINEFYLFNKEISLSDYLEKGYKNLNNYYTDKSYDTLDFNDELITKIYECMFNNYNDNLIERKYYDLSKLTIEEIDDITYTNNKETKKSNTDIINFISPMLRFDVPNKEEYKINVYIDGIRNYEYSYVDYKNGISYIYIKKSKVKSNSMIEFEYIKTQYDKVRSIRLLGDGSNQFLIPNCREIELLLDKNDERYIRVFHEVDSKYIKLEISEIIYDYNEDTLLITLKENTVNNDIYKISNTRFNKVYKYDTRKRGAGYTLNLSGFELTDCDHDNFRIYKNGRELPNYSYTIKTLPKDNTENNNIIIDLDIKYTVYELIEVEFIPNKIETSIYIDKLESDGKIDLLNNTNIRTGNVGNEFFTPLNQYYCLNGRRVMNDHYKIWCAKGLTLNNLRSQKHFSLLNVNESILNLLMEDFYNYYANNCRYLFSQFVVTIMKGFLTDDESDCTGVNIERTGELYYDLYQEFLKHNIISIGDPLPEYIAFKYAGLVDEGMNNSIMIDTTEDQLYWMPLDATMESEDNLIKIMNLYYKLLDDINELVVVDPDDIPDELYNTYKDLFDNNVLVLQVPEYFKVSSDSDTD